MSKTPPNPQNPNQTQPLPQQKPKQPVNEAPEMPDELKKLLAGQQESSTSSSFSNDGDYEEYGETRGASQNQNSEEHQERPHSAIDDHYEPDETLTWHEPAGGAGGGQGGHDGAGGHGGGYGGQGGYDGHQGDSGYGGQGGYDGHQGGGGYGGQGGYDGHQGGGGYGGQGGYDGHQGDSGYGGQGGYDGSGAGYYDNRHSGMNHEHPDNFGHPYSHQPNSDWSGDSGNSYGKDHGYGTDGHGMHDAHHPHNQMHSDMLDPASHNNDPVNHAQNNPLMLDGVSSEGIKIMHGDVSQTLGGSIAGNIDSELFGSVQSNAAFAKDMAASVGDGTLASPGNLAHGNTGFSFEGFETQMDLGALPSQLTKANNIGGVVFNQSEEGQSAAQTAMNQGSRSH